MFQTNKEVSDQVLCLLYYIQNVFQLPNIKNNLILLYLQEQISAFPRQHVVALIAEVGEEAFVSTIRNKV